MITVPCPLSRLAATALMAGCLCLGAAALAADETLTNVAPNPSFELDAARLGGWLPLGVETTNGSSRVFITNSIHLLAKRGNSLWHRPWFFKPWIICINYCTLWQTRSGKG